jgi:hypothetical protein
MEIYDLVIIIAVSTLVRIALRRIGSIRARRTWSVKKDNQFLTPAELFAQPILEDCSVGDRMRS